MSANVAVGRMGKEDISALISEGDRMQPAIRYINAASCQTDLGKMVLEYQSMCKYVRSKRKSL
jgi:hypothetical protein